MKTLHNVIASYPTNVQVPVRSGYANWFIVGQGISKATGACLEKKLVKQNQTAGLTGHWKLTDYSSDGKGLTQVESRVTDPMTWHKKWVINGEVTESPPQDSKDPKLVTTPPKKIHCGSSQRNRAAAGWFQLSPKLPFERPERYSPKSPIQSTNL